VLRAPLEGTRTHGGDQPADFDEAATVVTDVRLRLFGIAYLMLGSALDAERAAALELAVLLLLEKLTPTERAAYVLHR
jgi:hypothetical protein